MIIERQQGGYRDAEIDKLDIADRYQVLMESVTHLDSQRGKARSNVACGRARPPAADCGRRRGARPDNPATGWWRDRARQTRTVGGCRPLRGRGSLAPAAW